jgi:hypothetical protein
MPVTNENWFSTVSAMVVVADRLSAAAVLATAEAHGVWSRFLPVLPRAGDAERLWSRIDSDFCNGHSREVGDAHR